MVYLNASSTLAAPVSLPEKGKLRASLADIRVKPSDPGPSWRASETVDAPARGASKSILGRWALTSPLRLLSRCGLGVERVRKVAPKSHPFGNIGGRRWAGGRARAIPSAQNQNHAISIMPFFDHGKCHDPNCHDSKSQIMKSTGPFPRAGASIDERRAPESHPSRTRTAPGSHPSPGTLHPSGRATTPSCQQKSSAQRVRYRVPPRNNSPVRERLELPLPQAFFSGP